MKRYIFQGKVYDSKSEAAIGKLLCKYLKFNPIESITLHARGDTNTNFDFILPEVIIEWHPMKRYRESTKKYKSKKQKAVENSEMYKGKEVIIISNIEDFYNLVLLRFMNNPPQKKEVRNQFRYATKRVKSIEHGRLEKILSSEFPMGEQNAI